MTTPMTPAATTLHEGLIPDPVTPAIQSNISMSLSNVFTPRSAGFSAKGKGLTDHIYQYARWANSTVRALETRGI